MVSIRRLAGGAIAVALALAASAHPSAAQSATVKALEGVADRGPSGCAASPPSTPFNASLVGNSYSLAFECYRPRSPLRFVVREQALVMTDEDGGGYNVKCAGDIVALRFGRAWTRPYFNIKPGVDIFAAFGDYNNLPARFGDSCDKVRAELGVKDVQYGPWGAGRAEFTRLLCLMVRLVRMLRDFRCDTINGPIRYEPAVLDSPFATLVTWLESIAYLYNVAV